MFRTTLKRTHAEQLRKSDCFASFRLQGLTRSRVPFGTERGSSSAQLDERRRLWDGPDILPVKSTTTTLPEGRQTSGHWRAHIFTHSTCDCAASQLLVAVHAQDNVRPGATHVSAPTQRNHHSHPLDDSSDRPASSVSLARKTEWPTAAENDSIAGRRRRPSPGAVCGAGRRRALAQARAFSRWSG